MTDSESAKNAENAQTALVQKGDTGSLNRRMITIAAAWILVLLLGGGIILDRVLENTITRNFDEQLEYVLNAMIASAEIGQDGEVLFNRPLGDQRVLRILHPGHYGIAACHPKL